MPVTSVTTNTDDPQSPTLTIVADFTASLRRLWDAYTDPRQIEKFWGPPTCPATFTRHDAYPGGLSTYHMPGAEGDHSNAYWEWIEVEAPHRFVVKDGFANDDGTPSTELPSVQMTFEFVETALGARVTTVSTFNSLAELEQLTEMGMIEGTKEAMSQIDDVLTDLASFAAGRATELQLVGDNQARVSRVVRGSLDQVWAAHTEAELLKKWQLGPDGWSMPVCITGDKVGDTYRSEWQNDETGERFGFTGEVTEISAPNRLVTTEKMISPDNPEGTGSPETLNELTLTPVEGGTLVSYIITYPDAGVRDQVLATGMVEGMEGSFARLESVVL
ncbi:MAG TPA: SRPBCC domain-containing protein [Candidatus Corynebacterium avicola]|uniref:SRPBCC domain-containing protein n=1 Tax=Candidatus Corynebacterium avicola TaxID=2838527 RepID=A0A9D1RQ22_9CORY|nr:SRPBCC domain-containing protein [Candidatus Corynebacterium avicola]